MSEYRDYLKNSSQRNNKKQKKRQCWVVVIILALAIIFYLYKEEKLDAISEMFEKYDTVETLSDVVGILKSATVGDRELPIYCVDTKEKEVALSFDAAWGAVR